MKEIERLTNYTFFYNNGDFDLKRIVSVAAVRKPVAEVVRQMLPDCSCRFENRRIILVKDAAPQSQTVKGVVKDEKGAPVIGATVLVTDAGQTRGISTDMNGGFTLTLPALTAEAMLEVSFIGFDTYKSAIGSRTFFDVVLTYAQQSIDEVVVVGYGVQKKANLTGAVATVSQKELKDRPVSNVGRALQGVIPNLNVKLSSGQPGAGATYNIRGTTSPNGGSPLVLIDGVETYPDRINSNDIESITVLKDASSAAIYGARGAFGVILITTKSGKYNEKAEVSYNGYFSVSSPTTSTDYETRGYYSAKIADFFMMATQNTPYTSYTEQTTRPSGSGATTRPRTRRARGSSPTSATAASSTSIWPTSTGTITSTTTAARRGTTTSTSRAEPRRSPTWSADAITSRRASTASSRTCSSPTTSA